MDLDGDGINDVISGSYWPGDMFWFKGLAGGKYAKSEKIKGADGKDLNTGGPWESDQKPDMDSLATAPFAADLDGDGDLDLLVGNIAGHVMYVRNDGTAKEPKFASRSRIQADGGEITVPGGDAGPTLVDWDGDGDLDLIVGAGDGSVWLYPNRGTKTKPDFARGEALVASSTSHGAPATNPTGSAPKGPGSRAKVCVTDWNGDGRLDLLVGDFSSVQKPDPDLTAEQKKRRDELLKLQREASAKLGALSEKGLKSGDAEYAAALEQYSKINSELRPLQGGSDHHGWVWLFLRKAKSVAGV